MKRSMRDGISRRDFMNGIALSLAAGTALSPLECLAMSEASEVAASSVGLLSYPPSLTGLRGNHAGSFEVAHALSWEGRSWPDPSMLTDETYDLIVVGGGLSGLASAHVFLRKKPDAQILILDNHDDFGGHAKRNEFTIGNKRLIGYGGSQSIDGPADFSPQSKNILQDLGVDVEKFYTYFDRNFYKERHLEAAVFFDQAHFGKNILRDHLYSAEEKGIEGIVNSYPLSDTDRSALIHLWNGEEDYLSGKSISEKIKLLRGISYDDFLRKYAHMSEEVITFLRNLAIGLWGVGFDALSALEAFRLDMLGFEALGLDPAQVPVPYEKEEPYIFHFPDGNAGLTRLLVRRLIPDVAQGSTMEDIVRAEFDYQHLDKASSDVRLRLLSTVVKAVHHGDGKTVDITYVRAGQVAKVRGEACDHGL